MAKKLARKTTPKKAARASEAGHTENGGRPGQVRLLLRPQDGWRRIDEAAARRQGREPRRDVPHRAAGAARVHDHHRGLHLLLRQQADVSADAAQGDGERDRLARAADRQEVRRPEEPAARLGALRRPRLDAGHDGHDPQPRPERRHRRGAGDQDRESAICVGLLPPLRADVLRRRARRAEAARRGSRSVRDGHSHAQARAPSRGHRRHQAERRRSQGARGALQGPGQGAVRQAVPEIAVGPAARRRRRGVRIVDERPGDRLPAQVQHPDRVGHRRQRPGDGLRQHRRRTPARGSRSRATRRTASRSSTASS